MDTEGEGIDWAGALRRSPTEAVGLRLPQALVTRIDAIAEATGSTRTRVMRALLLASLPDAEESLRRDGALK